VLAVRDTAAAVALVCVLGAASVPSPDIDPPDWARLHARHLRFRSRREELLFNALPSAA
jgi:hypothetical protein